MEIGISNLQVVRAAQSLLEKPKEGVPEALTVLRLQPDGTIVAVGGPTGYYLLHAENAIEEFSGNTKYLRLEKGIPKAANSGYFDITEGALVTDKDPIPFSEVEVADYPDFAKLLFDATRTRIGASDRGEFGFDLKPIYDIVSSFDSWPRQGKFWFRHSTGGRAFLETGIDGLTILVRLLERTGK